MKILVKAIGKIANPELAALGREYISRCKILKVEVQEYKEGPNALGWLTTNNREGFVIALTERGQSLTSVQFSDFIFKQSLKSAQRKIVFLIGGSEGIPKTFLTSKEVNLCLSFGQLTFPHQLFRVILLEQLYRAETIYRSHPYHK